MAERESPESARLIELGWLVAGELSDTQRDAVDAARDIVAKQLGGLFPQFSWRIPMAGLVGTAAAGVDEPAARLHQGMQERDARAWDFAVVITPRDLRSHFKTYALAVPSRALAVAVLSLARLDGDHHAAGSDVLERRVAALVLHLFGDLNGLWHRDEPDAVMQPPQAVADLDLARSFDDEEREELAAALAEVADLRLEEGPEPLRIGQFYLRATRERAGEIASAVAQARPWEFPLRLSRLTAAAFSALFILLVTAEVWDLGTTQRGPTVAALSLLVLGGATAFILVRQKLLLRRARRRISEQAVVTNVSAVLVVLFGLASTYAILFGSTVLLGITLFGPDLIARWAPTVDASRVHGPLLAMAGLVASLGLLIGSLGASFEGDQYFRHVIYADEET